MKSDHRHELKTNELAEWLSNLPQWTKENLKTIIIVSVLVVTVAGFYIWRTYTKNVIQVRQQLEFTNLLNQLSTSKMQVRNARAQGRDLSFILIQPANNLGSFARNAKNDRMAALALIKQAEALRMELHYRAGTISREDLTSQINQAKAAYTEAIETRLNRTPDPYLMAMAEFGLGLCEEELGNFDKARQIYKDITQNPDFKGVALVDAANHRLNTMADYRNKVTFKPAPTPADASASQSTTDFDQLPGALDTATNPLIQGPVLPSTEDTGTIDTNLPAEINPPVDVNKEPQILNILPDVNSEAPEPNVSVK
jgi:tetratricopeptide (TPR) repeat protein